MLYKIILSLAFVLQLSVCTSIVDFPLLLSKKETKIATPKSSNTSGESNVLLVNPLFFAEQ